MESSRRSRLSSMMVASLTSRSATGTRSGSNAVLFTPNGGEIAVMEPQEGPLDGEYEWEVDGRTYRLALRSR